MKSRDTSLHLIESRKAQGERQTPSRRHREQANDIDRTDRAREKSDRKRDSGES